MTTNFHYLSRYYKIIEYYKHNPVDGFVEKHHILPRCKGGTDGVENLILLPTRVHFICHYLLHKAYPNDVQLAHAFAMMGVNNAYQQRCVSRLYEKSKLARSLALRGVPRSEDVKQKLRKPKQNKENYKKPKSTKHKENISRSLRGRKVTWMNKVKESSAYIEHVERKKEQSLAKKNFHRENFQKLNISRKEYYKLYPDVKAETLKTYLRFL